MDTKISFQSKILFEQDGWMLIKYVAEPIGWWSIDEKLNSRIFHKCIKHPKMEKVWPCHKDWDTERFRCSNCDLLVPMEVVGVWTLHNFDYQAKDFPVTE